MLSVQLICLDHEQQQIKSIKRLDNKTFPFRISLSSYADLIGRKPTSMEDV